MESTFRLTRHSRLVLYPGIATPLDSVVVLIYSQGEWILIDSGPGVRESITAIMASLALIPENLRPPPKFVINTHGHINNAGGDWWLHSMGAIIVAHPPDSRWIETGDPVKTAAVNYNLSFHPTPVGLELRGKERDIALGDLTIKVIHTPGHTPGSQSVILDDNGVRLVIVGDSLGSLSSDWESNEDLWLESLIKIKDLSADILCTSVRCYIGGSAKEYIRKVEKEGPVWIARND